MANTYSYTFDSPNRIGLDQCNISQTDIQNVASCNYQTQNYFASDCSMKNPISLATSQPGIMYNGGYTFDNMSRIGLDNCNISQTDIQNVASCNYQTQNYFASDCSMKNPISLATSQPGIMYNGGYNSGAGGCNINDSSQLQIGTIQTHPRSRIDLFQRPFATVPFLGRGSVNPVMEAQIQQGEQIVNKRSVNNLSEKSYIKYHQTPLLPAVQEKIKNSTIESDASQGWIRGGVPSRELTRDADYNNKHSTYQYA